MLDGVGMGWRIWELPKNFVWLVEVGGDSSKEEVAGQLPGTLRRVCMASGMQMRAKRREVAKRSP